MNQRDLVMQPPNVVDAMGPSVPSRSAIIGMDRHGAFFGDRGLGLDGHR